VEKATVILLEHKVTGLPVIYGEDLVGVLSQGDIFRVLNSITGIYRGSTQFAFSLPNKPGTIK
jgi:acetoin utilization protein AcuB